ncbi:MAG: hypothetical protein WBV82_03150 [Myxococcaceae bacterium]
MANEKRNRRDDLEPELKVEEMKITPPTEIQKIGADLEKIATELANMPLPAQLAFLRLVTPKVLENIDPAARDALLDQLKSETPSNN